MLPDWAIASSPNRYSCILSFLASLTVHPLTNRSLSIGERTIGPVVVLDGPSVLRESTEVIYCVPEGTKYSHIHYYNNAGSGVMHRILRPSGMCLQSTPLYTLHARSHSCPPVAGFLRTSKDCTMLSTFFFFFFFLSISR